MSAKGAPSVIPAEVAHFDALGRGLVGSRRADGPAAQDDAFARRLGS